MRGKVWRKVFLTFSHTGIARWPEREEKEERPAALSDGPIFLKY